MWHRSLILAVLIVAFAAGSKNVFGATDNWGNSVVWADGYPKKGKITVFPGVDRDSAKVQYTVTPANTWGVAGQSLEIWVYQNSDGTGYNGKDNWSFTQGPWSGERNLLIGVPGSSFRAKNNFTTFWDGRNNSPVNPGDSGVVPYP